MLNQSVLRDAFISYSFIAIVYAFVTSKVYYMPMNMYRTIEQAPHKRQWCLENALFMNNKFKYCIAYTQLCAALLSSISFLLLLLLWSLSPSATVAFQVKQPMTLHLCWPIYWPSTSKFINDIIYLLDHFLVSLVDEIHIYGNNNCPCAPFDEIGLLSRT